MFVFSLNRLIKWVVSKIVIDDHMENKRINNKLPPHKRKIMPHISDLQIPRFKAGAIGAIHEAAEIFLLGAFNCNSSFRYFDISQ